MLQILQARIQQYVNHELPDVEAGFRKDNLLDPPKETQEEADSLILAQRNWFQTTDL